MKDDKRRMDVLFGILGAAIVLGPVVAALGGCTGTNPARDEPAASLAPFLGVSWPDTLEGAAGAAGEAPDASWGAIRPDLGEGEVDAGADAGEAPDAVPFADLSCSPFTATPMRWTVEACEALGEGDACDNLGQWDGEARCVRFGSEFCRDNPRTAWDECFACAPCEARR